MEITKEQYREILKKQDKGEILLYIDTVKFREFFAGADNEKTKNLLGESLGKESFIIRSIMFAESLSLIMTIVISIFLFRWFSVLVVPVVFLLWGFWKGQASIGRKKILFPICLFVVGIMIAISNQDREIWFKLFIVGLPSIYLLTNLLYYFTAYFGFKLIHRNYFLFKTFYEKPEGATIPFIWSEKIK